MRALHTLIIWGGAVFISAIFVDSLRFKFTGHPTPAHIFQTLRDWSGVGLFYPAGPWLIGGAELLAAALLLIIPAILLATGGAARRIAQSQFLGALIAFAVMSGAIIFHLFTPLGVETPVAWADGTPTAFSAALFYSACVTWALAALIMIFRRASLAH